MAKRSGTPIKRLVYLFKDPDSFVFTWNRGWITYKVLTNENERIFHITSAWNCPNSKPSASKKAWIELLRIAKSCKCKTMRIKTGRNPNSFARKYGFKTIIRTMERKI
tara:strand:+ start:11830 stop:12153 length:324 start_codon:yes stop_codon:yes gene_type:complete